MFIDKNDYLYGFPICDNDSNNNTNSNSQNIKRSHNYNIIVNRIKTTPTKRKQP